MIFNDEVFVDPRGAQIYYNEITTHVAKSGIMQQFVKKIERDSLYRTRVFLGMQKDARFFKYENLIVKRPTFDRENPLEIEKFIVYLCALCDCLNKNYTLGLLQLMRELERTAKKTFASRKWYYLYEA